ncbi:hypothetical protein G5714_024732 [Onychostoma macrolepis]|uniref:Uncharacterized protein n=1 Tax=Onychostoma macrolepis TaxID=369639 RepID=A0A7J6BHH2_9TELE|nr:hypothetical protein G5714_024732 [Onychostoma macrolepis]
MSGSSRRPVRSGRRRGESAKLVGAQQCRDKAGPKTLLSEKDARARGGGGEGEVGGSGAVLPAHPVGLKTFNPKKSRNTGCGKGIGREPDTLIIDTSNALCGPGFLPGPRLPEGRFPIDRGLRVPRLELRRGLLTSSVLLSADRPGSASRPGLLWPLPPSLSLPYGGGGRAAPRLRLEDRRSSPPRLPVGLNPLRCPRDGDLQLSSVGGRRFGGRAPSVSLVPSGGRGGRRRHVRSVLRGPGVSTPNSRADGRTPSFVGGDARPWGFPDGVRCAPGGDRLDSGQPPVPLGIAERPPRPPPSTTSVAASEEGRAQRRIPAPATGRGKCGVQKTALSARAGGPSPSDGGLARGRCEAVAAPPAECGSSWSRVAWECSPKGKRVGSARSARRIQPGGSGRPGRCAWIPFGGDRRPAVGSAAVGRTSSEAVRRDRLRFGQEGSGGEGGSQPPVASFTEPPRPTLPLPRVVGSVLAPSLLPTGEGRGPSLPVCASTGADCPQSVSDRAAPSGRGSGPRKGCSRSAARSATHPTRLETRTKESNARASQRVSSSPHGAMKVKAGARRSRWDPRPATGEGNVATEDRSRRGPGPKSF